MGWGVGWVWGWDGTLSVQDLVRDGCRGVVFEGGRFGWWRMGWCGLLGWFWLLLVSDRLGRSGGAVGGSGSLASLGVRMVCGGGGLIGWCEGLLAEGFWWWLRCGACWG